ncbi:MAG: hypothetical protein HY398_01315 [Candidatus Doudnabacteria bacterium]|nr:hypothetical protein [Candidatus Doudnabacteria bacterium]
MKNLWFLSGLMFSVLMAILRAYAIVSDTCFWILFALGAIAIYKLICRDIDRDSADVWEAMGLMSDEELEKMLPEKEISTN